MPPTSPVLPCFIAQSQRRALAQSQQPQSWLSSPRRSLGCRSQRRSPALTESRRCAAGFEACRPPFAGHACSVSQGRWRACTREQTDFNASGVPRRRVRRASPLVARSSLRAGKSAYPDTTAPGGKSMIPTAQTAAAWLSTERLRSWRFPVVRVVPGASPLPRSRRASNCPRLDREEPGQLSPHVCERLPLALGVELSKGVVEQLKHRGDVPSSPPRKPEEGWRGPVGVTWLLEAAQWVGGTPRPGLAQHRPGALSVWCCFSGPGAANARRLPPLAPFHRAGYPHWALHHLVLILAAARVPLLIPDGTATNRPMRPSSHFMWTQWREKQ